MIIENKLAGTDASEKKNPFARKLFHISISLVISLVAGKMVLLPFLVALKVLHLLNILNAGISLLGISLALFVIVSVFRKLYKYFHRIG